MARGTRTTDTTAPERKGTTSSKVVPKTSAERPPAMTKDELRARVEKLERANTLLRAKGREANRAAKTADARIAELEAEVEGLERRVAAQAGAAKRGAKRTAAREPASTSIDPGDAVPEGVAVSEPAPLDEEAKTVLENLDEHLGN